MPCAPPVERAKMNELFVKFHNAFSSFMADLVDIIEYFANIFADVFHWIEKHDPEMKTLVKGEDFWYALIVVAMALSLFWN